jgi:uncharacterized delta-60 repeat protein
MSGVVLSFLGSGAGGVLYWIATLGGAGTDIGTGIAVDSAGNAYALGYTNSQGAGGQDFALAKYNESGGVEWQRTLGNSNSEFAFGIAVDASSNVYVVGGANDPAGAGQDDHYIAKYNSSGTLQWQRALGSGANEYNYGAAVDSSGNIYLTGRTINNAEDVTIFKYDTSGALQWQRRLSGGGNDQGRAIAVDSSGNSYIAGFTDSQGAGDQDLLLTKYDTSGTIQFQRVLGGIGADAGFGIALDSSGNIYVTGRNGSSGAGSNDILVAKYNSSATLQWQRSLGGAGDDQGYGIAVDASGNSFIAGYSNGGNEIVIARYDTSGTLQWQRQLSGSGIDYAHNIAITPTGAMYVVGTTTSTGPAGSNIVLAKLPSDGTKTGTYGPWTYSASTLTAATSTLTAATSTLTASTSTLTQSTPTLTSSTSTLTSTVTMV